MRNRIQIVGLSIDRCTLPEVVQQLLVWSRTPSTPCRYVVTPNVDHAVIFQNHTAMRAAYDDAALVLADGMPLVWASRLLRQPLPERVPGSDLVPSLFAAVSKDAPLRVYLLGAAPGVAQQAAANIGSRWPAVKVVGTYSPPFGFERHVEENAAILRGIAAAKPEVLIVGFGAPKQEIWVHSHRHLIAAPVALCVGATIDFLAGHLARAPVWMQTSGLEWVHRLAQQPRRLAIRYARDACVFPRLLLRDLVQSRRAS